MRVSPFGPLLLTVAVCAAAPCVRAQEATPQPAGHGAATEHGAEGGHAEHHSPLIEVEFAGSSIFQSGTIAVKLASPLRAEVHYFGVDGEDIGTAGLAWEFRWGGFRLLPGVSWSVSENNGPSAALTARWVFENEDWISQGLWVQSLGDYVPPDAHEGEHGDHAAGGEAVVKYASVLDGIHVSRRLGRLEVGPLVEHVRYREEDAWKGGGRVAVRIGRSFRLVGQVVGPDTEVRVGFAWER